MNKSLQVLIAYEEAQTSKCQNKKVNNMIKCTINPSAPCGASTADPVLLEAFASVYLVSWIACCNM